MYLESNTVRISIVIHISYIGTESMKSMHQVISPIRPFQYHIDLKDFLSKKEKMWTWFSEDKAKSDFFEKFKRELLKDSYRMDASSHPALYSLVDDIKQKLDLSIKVTIYQEQMSYYNNVGISFYEDEAHIIISGRVLKLMEPEEMKAILAHELYHYYFFEIDQKSFEITDRIITSIANDSRSEDVYLESARIFKLYTELYCDRGAYEVMGDIKPVISALVKLSTGLEKVDPESYLNQSEEVLKNQEDPTKKTTHPESFVRAKALSIWAEKGEDGNEEIVNLIEPKIEFEKLNVFSQQKLDDYTQKLISIFLKPNWNKTERIRNLANEYVPNLNLKPEVDAESFFEELNTLGDTSKKFLAYILLDFSLVDPDQGNTSLGYAFELAENGGMKDEFKLVVKKEIKLTERKFKDLQQSATESLNSVNESKEDSLYGE